MSNKIKIQSMNGTAGKETVYVDVDDEITTIINKVQDAKGKVVALVLPKRSPVLQSIVNMKLLKRTADTADKNLVLVTAEAGLMPLAGAVGLYVASSPTSKPSIPSAPVGPDDEPELASEPLQIVDGNVSAGHDEFDRAASGDKTVGELTASRASGNKTDNDVDEAIDMPDDTEDSSPDDDPATSLSNQKRNRKLSVPNFDSFRKKLVLAVLGLVVLIAGWVYAFRILPQAAITIHTNNSTVTTNLNLVLDTTAKALDQTSNIVPATLQSQQKTASEQAAATGKQNNGDKATGTVEFSARKCSGNPFIPPNGVSAGTTVSADGHTYIVQKTVSFNGVDQDGTCFIYATNPAAVIALKGGADYNTDGEADDVKVTGRSDVSGTLKADGGTDDIITIVQQSDIDSATDKISAADSDSMKQQLVSGLQSKGLLPVPSTFLAGNPEVTTNVKAGDAAGSVTVTSVTTYTMLGVQKADLQKLVVANVDDHIDKSRQVILDDGIANAEFTQDNPATTTGANVAMRTRSEAGPQLDVGKLKTELVGKKAGDVKNLIGQTPGVTSVDVDFSPFWVNVVPKGTDKIIINIAKVDS